MAQTSLQILQGAILNLDMQIANVLSSPKPTYSIDGKNVNWESYLGTLLDKRAVLARQIQEESGPFQLETVYRT